MYCPYVILIMYYILREQRNKNQWLLVSSFLEVNYMYVSQWDLKYLWLWYQHWPFCFQTNGISFFHWNLSNTSFEIVMYVSELIINTVLKKKTKKKMFKQVSLIHMKNPLLHLKKNSSYSTKIKWNGNCKPWLFRFFFRMITLKQWETWWRIITSGCNVLTRCPSSPTISRTLPRPLYRP